MVGPVRAAQQWGSGSRRRRGIGRRLAAAARLTCCVVAAVGAVAAPAASETREPCASHNPLRNPYFGDLHVHTALSLDASTQGTRTLPRRRLSLRPRRAARRCRPSPPTARRCASMRLARPLDFAAVTDHAELFGELTICQTPGPARLRRAAVRDLPALAAPGLLPRQQPGVEQHGAAALQLLRRRRRAPAAAPRDTPWQVVREAAEGAYDRSAACRFTTFVGYEWTGAPGQQQPAPQRHLPQRRGARPAGQLRRGAAAPSSSGSSSPTPAASGPAATCSPSRTTRT